MSISPTGHQVAAEMPYPRRDPTPVERWYFDERIGAMTLSITEVRDIVEELRADKVKSIGVRQYQARVGAVLASAIGVIALALSIVTAVVR